MGYGGPTPSILKPKKTQMAFSRLLGIPVATIRDWEQGRKQPDRGGPIYLNNFFHFLSGSTAPVMLPPAKAAS